MSLFLGANSSGTKMLHIMSSWVSEAAIKSNASNTETIFTSTEPFFVIDSVEHYNTPNVATNLSATYATNVDNVDIIPLVFAHSGGVTYPIAAAGLGIYYDRGWKIKSSPYIFTIAYIKKISLATTPNQISIKNGVVTINGTNFNTLMFLGISLYANNLDEEYSLSGIGIIQFLNAKDVSRTIKLRGSALLFEKNGIEYPFISPINRTRMITRCEISAYVQNRAISGGQCLPISLAIPSNTILATIVIHIAFTGQYYTLVLATHAKLNTTFNVNQDFTIADTPNGPGMGNFIYTASTKTLVYQAHQTVLSEQLLEYKVKGL